MMLYQKWLQLGTNILSVYENTLNHIIATKQKIDGIEGIFYKFNKGERSSHIWTNSVWRELRAHVCVCVCFCALFGAVICSA